MISIVFIIVAVVLFSTQETIRITTNYELSKRNKRILGIVTAISGLVIYFLPRSSEGADINPLYLALPVLAPLSTLFALSQKRLKDDLPGMSQVDKVANVITWIILFGVLGLAFWWVYTID